MKSFFSLFLLTLLALGAVAQEKVIYDANAEKRAITSFHAVKVSQGIELLLKQGNEEALAISAQTKEQADAVKTEVVNGELRIYIKQDLEKWWQQLRRKGVQVKAYVSFKNLDRLDVSSGARTTVDGVLSAQKLNVDLSSGAVLKGKVAVTTMDIDVSSGAKTDINGQVQDLSVNSSSGAHFNGFDLTAVTAKADASSGGKLELSVTKDLDASASSGGAISYKGGGSISNVSTSSGGRVRKAG